MRKTIGSDYTEYLRFGGNVITERKPNGDWSDYIFLGSKRIAKTDSFANRLHTYGTRCSSCGTQWDSFVIPASSGTGYVLRSGDRLYLRQWQSSGARGGIRMWFTDGTNTTSASDSDGQNASSDNTTGSWHGRTIDLSSYAGKVMDHVELDASGNTTPGNWDIYFQDVALVSNDGSVRPWFSNESSASLTATGQSGSTQSYAVDHCTACASAPLDTTAYYHTDHVGSSRMISSAQGWPIWQGTFLPFGYEYNPQITANHYKFAGYEHDDESGLENANDRMMSSQLARFTSPDPLSGDVLDPQSLNRYAYVQNSPLTGMDSTGDYKESVDPDLPVFTSQWDNWLTTGQMGCFMCGTDNSRQSFNSASLGLFGLDYYLIPGHQGLGSNEAAEGLRHDDIITGKGDPELGLGPTTTTFTIADPAANLNEPKDQQKEKLAIELGKTACEGQSTDAVAGCIGEVYNSDKFRDGPLKGGNFNFTYQGVTVEGNDLMQMVIASGDCGAGLGGSYRCGDWNSIHFVGGMVHLDTANPFNPILAPAHLGVDVIGGNTFWKNGIPRH